MLRWAEKIFLTLLMTIALAEAAEQPVPQGIKKLYGWLDKYDPSAAEKSFERDAAAGDLYSSGMSLLLKRRKIASAEASALDNELHRHIDLLVEKISRQPDELSCFVLSELLDDPVSPARDRELAFWLCKYSAEKNFPPAQLKLAEHLINNPSKSGDLLLAEKLLLEAAATLKAPANWQLYRLYRFAGQRENAEKFLQQAVNSSSPEAIVEQAYRKNSLTLDIARLTGRGKFLYSIKNYMAMDQKITLCMESAAANCSDGSLAMAVLFSELVYEDKFMSFNAAMLAENLQDGDRRPLQLMQELDNSHKLGTAMLAMWQGELKSSADLQRAGFSDSDLQYDLFMKSGDPANRRRVEEALQKTPEAFYLSGLAFDLKKYKYSYPQIKELLLKTPPVKDMLPVIIAQLLIAGENADHTWQLELSEKLLKMVAKKYSSFQLRDHRKKLIAVIPGAAARKLTFELNSPEITLAVTWNLAVYMHVNALLEADRTADAEKILQKYHRLGVNDTLKNMERNFLQRFAPGLWRKISAPAAK